MVILGSSRIEGQLLLKVLVGSEVCYISSQDELQAFGGASMKYVGCQGSGMKVYVRQLGPTIIQQVQHACPYCKGSGETIHEKNKCPNCKGEKIVQDKKVLEVHV